jgi:flavin-dependent dehydrogenase
MNGVDALIVGGGPAGLTAALALRQRGARVTVADARRPPIDKACGEGLMPDSVRELRRLGVHLDATDGGIFRGIRFVSHGQGKASRAAVRRVKIDEEIEAQAEARFPAIGEEGERSVFALGPQDGLGVKRPLLHERLVRAAEDAGVELRWNTLVRLLPDGTVRVAGEDCHYGCLIGADGQGSRLRRWAGLDAGQVLSSRFGFRQHYRVRPWNDTVEVHWCRRGQAYVTPVGAEEVCVATIARDPHCRVEALLEEMPWLRRKLAGTTALLRTDRERGALTTTRRLRRVATGRVALVGDASGSADAITGEGMAMAFRQALLLADALAKLPVDRALARYNREHPRILRLPQRMARVMLLMDRWPGFRSRTIRMLAAEPHLFARMLGVHVGAESLEHFVATRGPELAWRLVASAIILPAEMA